ncbi:MAG TPA: sigma 54-interacting transcriptional regulator, partial [Polyangiaceae bacterium]|nr:sigma 54-interacting transcriptional regulator [Polyangiaceae bacterium]
MDVANTAESDRPSRRMPAAAAARELTEANGPQSESKRVGRGSWAPPRPQLPAPSLRRRHVEPVRQFGRLSARSKPMVDVFDVLRRFAQTDVTMTFFGETGAGKDVIAHVLHEQSARAGGPFVVLDCGAVAANLAESELLGHERGAFTGAVSAHAGAFERANGGTLFLDEVGEM